MKEEDVLVIVKRKLDGLKKKYPSFKYSNSLVKEIVCESEYREYGARRIDKIIETKIEGLIIDKLLHHENLNISHLKECQSAAS